MFNRYWFLNSVPNKDLGFGDEEIRSDNNYYIIGGISGDLESIIEVYEILELRRRTEDQRLILDRKKVRLANIVLLRLIDSKKISIFGTLFNQSLLPGAICQHPELYVSSDDPSELGIVGMRGRSFAQPIRMYMEYYAKNIEGLNPIVMLDNEDDKIKKSVINHFEKHITKYKPEAKIKVHGIDQAGPKETMGYIVSDLICSIFWNYIHSPKEFKIFDDLISKAIKFDSKLVIQPSEGTYFAPNFVEGNFRSNFVTNQVYQWKLSDKSTIPSKSLEYIR